MAVRVAGMAVAVATVIVPPMCWIKITVHTAPDMKYSSDCLEDSAANSSPDRCRGKTSSSCLSDKRPRRHTQPEVVAAMVRTVGMNVVDENTGVDESWQLSGFVQPNIVVIAGSLRPSTFGSLRPSLRPSLDSSPLSLLSPSSACLKA